MENTAENNRYPEPGSDPNLVPYFASKHEGSKVGVSYRYASPSRWWVGLHGSTDPIVRVRVRERLPTDPSSNYWGWLDATDPSYYHFVWPSEVQLDMCFPYGPKAEEKKGRGRKVNLIVEEILDP